MPITEFSMIHFLNYNRDISISVRSILNPLMVLEIAVVLHIIVDFCWFIVSCTCSC
jgi:hypothetical protein